MSGRMEFWNIGMLRWGRSSFHVPLFRHSILPPLRSPNTFGARNLAGVAGHARRSNKKRTKERKVVNV
jgi:hypothetical protein